MNHIKVHDPTFRPNGLGMKVMLDNMPVAGDVVGIVCEFLQVEPVMFYRLDKPKKSGEAPDKVCLEVFYYLQISIPAEDCTEARLRCLWTKYYMCYIHLSDFDEYFANAKAFLIQPIKYLDRGKQTTIHLIFRHGGQIRLLCKYIMNKTHYTALQYLGNAPVWVQKKILAIIQAREQN